MSDHKTMNTESTPAANEVGDQRLVWRAPCSRERLYADAAITVFSPESVEKKPPNEVWFTLRGVAYWSTYKDFEKLLEK